MAGLKVPELKVTEKVSDLGGYLKEQRESARLSLRQLASAAGVSNPYLSQIERGLRKPSAEVLQGIAKGLQISAEALFQRAGLLENAGSAEVEAAIGSDARLTSRQKRVLLDIYATFRAENARTDGAQDQPEAAVDQDHTAPLPGDDTDADDDRQPAPVVSLVTSLPATTPTTIPMTRPATTPVTRRRGKKSAHGG